jgi:hypothetical protein
MNEEEIQEATNEDYQPKYAKESPWNWKRVVSIIAGSLSAVGTAYVALAANWSPVGFELPYPEQVNQTIAIVVQLMSMILAVVTGVTVKNDSK